MYYYTDSSGYIDKYKQYLREYFNISSITCISRYDQIIKELEQKYK